MTRTALRDPARLFVSLGVADRLLLSGFWLAASVRWTTELQLGPLELVLLGTVMELSVLIAEVPTGVVADVMSRKWSIVVSQLVMGAAIVLAGLAEAFPLLVVSQVAWGVGWTFRSGADVAWVTDEVSDPEGIERLLVRRARLQELGGLAGLGLGIAAGALTSLGAVMVAAGLGLVATGLALAAAMTEHGFARRSERRWRSFVDTLSQGAGVTRRSPSLRLLVGATLAAGFGSEVIDRLDIRRMEEVGLPEQVDAVVLVGAMGAATAVLSFALMGYVERRLDDGAAGWWYARISVGAAALVVAAALSPVLAVVVAAFVGQAALRRALDPIWTGWANREATSEVRATVLSFVGQADAGGQIVGGVALGALAATAGLPTALVVAGLLHLVAAALARRDRALRAPADRSA
ncbi:MAG: MFS transporter [Actinomycetota bacterium]